MRYMVQIRYMTQDINTGKRAKFSLELWLKHHEQ